MRTAAHLLTRRTWLCGAANAAAALSKKPEEWRGRVGGECCFVKFPTGAPNGEAVVTLHGAGEWVNETSSSWETQPGASRMMEALLAAGFMVTQSNSGARNGNGMWGNAATQRTTAALVDHLRTDYGARKVHAMAVSAGNLVLINLLLNRKARFDKVVMLAPCLSLASEYKCPGGVNRVKTIAEAFAFQPASHCPGDPVKDAAFLAATKDYDPLLITQRKPRTELASLLRGVQWMAVYETRDPRVPPDENILPFVERLRQAGIFVKLTPLEADTHGSQELYLANIARATSFLRSEKHA